MLQHPQFVNLSGSGRLFALLPRQLFRGLPIHVFHVQPGVEVEELCHDGGITLAGRVMQGSAVPSIEHVRLCAIVQQKLDHTGMAVKGGKVEGSESVGRANLVDVLAPGQQFHRLVILAVSARF